VRVFTLNKPGRYTIAVAMDPNAPTWLASWTVNVR